MSLDQAKDHILNIRNVKFKKNFMEQIQMHFNLSN